LIDFTFPCIFQNSAGASSDCLLLIQGRNRLAAELGIHSTDLVHNIKHFFRMVHKVSQQLWVTE